MDTLVLQQLAEAPRHAVLPGSGKYDLRCLRFAWNGDGKACLEMELSSHEDYATLRFEGVEDLQVDSGELPTAIRVPIQDTSQCPSATHRMPAVRVGGAGHTGLSFWAASVRRVERAG